MVNEEIRLTEENGISEEYEAKKSEVLAKFNARRIDMLKSITKSDDGRKIAYLTFDDGPSTVSTPKILDILDKYNVKATFFVLGKKLW